MLATAAAIAAATGTVLSLSQATAVVCLHERQFCRNRAKVPKVAVLPMPTASTLSHERFQIQNTDDGTMTDSGRLS